MITNVIYKDVNYNVITYTDDKGYRTIIANEDKHKFICAIIHTNEFEARLSHKNIVKKIGNYIEVNK